LKISGSIPSLITNLLAFTVQSIGRPFRAADSLITLQRWG